MSKINHFLYKRHCRFSQVIRILLGIKIWVFLFIWGIFIYAENDSSYEMYGYQEIRTNKNFEDKAITKIRNRMQNISVDEYKAYTFQGSNGTAINYRLLKPNPLDNNLKYPLIVLLHGSSAIGTDNIKQMGFLSKYFLHAEYRRKYPCFITALQFPTRSSVYVFSTKWKTRISRPLPCLYTAGELIKKLKNSLNIDPSRIYIIGFSMGGSSTWNMLSLNPELFAAAVPISGIPNPDEIGRIEQIPLWIIHGGKDRENSIKGDNLMYEILKKKGARKLRFWKFSDLGHFPPSILYDTDILLSWLFSQFKQS
jgi:predicted peptidase